MDKTGKTEYEMTVGPNGMSTQQDGQVNWGSYKHDWSPEKADINLRFTQENDTITIIGYNTDRLGDENSRFHSKGTSDNYVELEKPIIFTLSDADNPTRESLDTGFANARTQLAEKAGLDKAVLAADDGPQLGTQEADPTEINRPAEDKGLLGNNSFGLMGAALLALLGFMIGGPIGAILGALLGGIGGSLMGDNENSLARQGLNAITGNTPKAAQELENGETYQVMVGKNGNHVAVKLESGQDNNMNLTKLAENNDIDLDDAQIFSGTVEDGRFVVSHVAALEDDKRNTEITVRTYNNPQNISFAVLDNGTLDLESEDAVALQNDVRRQSRIEELAPAAGDSKTVTIKVDGHDHTYLRGVMNEGKLQVHSIVFDNKGDKDVAIPFKDDARMTATVTKDSAGKPSIKLEEGSELAKRVEAISGSTQAQDDGNLSLEEAANPEISPAEIFANPVATIVQGSTRGASR